MNAWIVEDFCTLPAAAQPFRLMEFDELFRGQVRPPRRIDPNRVEFIFANTDGLYAQVADLVARETTCCPFFEFTLAEHPHGAAREDHLVLWVGVPASREDVLEALTDRAVEAMGGAGDEQ
jgi:hypothetical protein